MKCFSAWIPQGMSPLIGRRSSELRVFLVPCSDHINVSASRTLSRQGPASSAFTAIAFRNNQQHNSVTAMPSSRSPTGKTFEESNMVRRVDQLQQHSTAIHGVCICQQASRRLWGRLLGWVRVFFSCHGGVELWLDSRLRDQVIPAAT